MKTVHFKRASAPVLLLAALLWGDYVSAQPVQPHGDEASAAVSSPLMQFKPLWENRKSTDPAGLSGFDAILKLKLEKGYSNLYPYAAALVSEAAQAEKENRLDDMRAALDMAEDLAPDFSGPDMCSSRISLSRGQLINAFASFIEGSKKKLNSFHGSLPLFFNSISVVIVTISWAMAMFAVMLIARYAKVVAHDLKERIVGFAPRPSYALAVAMLLFPIAFVPNFGVYAFIVFPMLWFYLSWRERAVAVAFAIMLACSPFAYKYLGQALVAASDPVFTAVVNVREDVWGEEDVAALKEALSSPDNPSLSQSGLDNAKFSLAVALMHLQRYTEAEPLFRELLNHPELAFEANLMLGNLYLRGQNYNAALAQYEEAAQIRPESFEAHFNMAAALSRPELVNSHAEYVERSDGELEKAKILAPQQMEIMTRYQLLDPGRIVADIRLPLGRIYGNMLEPSEKKSAAGQSLFLRTSGGIPLYLIPIVSISLIAVFGILTWLSTRFNSAHVCHKCGKAYCPKCQSAATRAGICVRCYYAFEQSAGMDPRAREQVRAESRIYLGHRARVAQILSIIIPGSGHLLEGRTVRGAIFGLAAFLYWASLSMSGGVMKTLWPNPAPAVLLPIILASMAYITLLLIAVWNAGAHQR